MKKFLILALLVASASCLTFDEYDEIYFEIFSELRGEPSSASTIVRLSFHDCVGGCDGCINMDKDSNAGLQSAINIMEAVWNTTTANGINIESRADLWAIGGRAAADYGMEGMPNHKDYTGTSQTWSTIVEAWVSNFPTFKYGREDCDSAPYTTDEHEFPSAHDNFTEIMTYFAKEFGFTDDQTVAIMGAHTYGGMDEDNSGYDGAWTTGTERNTFDGSLYYDMMIDSQYTFRSRSLEDDGETGDDARPLYSNTDSDGTQVGNFINADFAIVYDFTVDEDSRKVSCFGNNLWTVDDQTCDKASTYGTVAAFAADNDLWLEAYYEAYDLMTANGADSLTELDSSTTTTCVDIWTSTVCAQRESAGRCSNSNVITNCQATCGYC